MQDRDPRQNNDMVADSAVTVDLASTSFGNEGGATLTQFSERYLSLRTQGFELGT